MRLSCLQRLDFIQNEFSSNLVRVQTSFGLSDYEVEDREATSEQEPNKDVTKQVSSGTDLDGRYSKTNRQIAVWI